VLVFKLN